MICYGKLTVEDLIRDLGYPGLSNSYIAMKHRKTVQEIARMRAQNERSV